LKASVADAPARAAELLARHAPSFLRGRALVEAVVPATGKNSEIYLLRLDDGSRAVLRAMRPASACAEMAAALRFARERGAPVPAVLAATGGFARFLRRDEAVLVEEFAEGRLWKDEGFSHETNAAVVRAVADLHNVTRERIGMLGSPRGGSPHDAILESTLAILREFDAAKVGCAADEPAQWADAAKALHARMPRAEACSLVHKHLGKSDAMVGTDGRVTLLDCANLAFDHFGGDLADILETVRRNGAGEQVPDLAAEYFARRRGLPTGAGWDAFGPFLLLAHHVKRVRAMLRKSAADRPDRDAELAESVAALRALRSGRDVAP